MLVEAFPACGLSVSRYALPDRSIRGVAFAGFAPVPVSSTTPHTIFAIADEPPTWPGADDDDIGLESISDPEEAEEEVGMDDGDVSSASHAPFSNASHGVSNSSDAAASTFSHTHSFSKDNGKGTVGEVEIEDDWDGPAAPPGSAGDACDTHRPTHPDPRDDEGVRRWGGYCAAPHAGGAGAADDLGLGLDGDETLLLGAGVPGAGTGMGPQLAAQQAIRPREVYAQQQAMGMGVPLGMGVPIGAGGCLLVSASHRGSIFTSLSTSSERSGFRAPPLSRSCFVFPAWICSLECTSSARISRRLTLCSPSADLRLLRRDDTPSRLVLPAVSPSCFSSAFLHTSRRFPVPHYRTLLDRHGFAPLPPPSPHTALSPPRLERPLALDVDVLAARAPGRETCHCPTRPRGSSTTSCKGERRRVECEWERAGPGHDEPGDGAGETRAGTVVRRQGWYSHRMTRASRRYVSGGRWRQRINHAEGMSGVRRAERRAGLHRAASERRNQSSAVAQLSGNILRGVTVRDATYHERVARRMVKAQKAEARPMGGAGELKGEPVGRADGGYKLNNVAEMHLTRPEVACVIGLNFLTSAFSYPPPSPTRLTSVTFSAFKAAATVSLQDGVNYEEYTWAPPIRGIEMIIWAKEQSQIKEATKETWDLTPTNEPQTLAKAHAEIITIIRRITRSVCSKSIFDRVYPNKGTFAIG
ncbi:hypothetical protein B0H10DRAFT_2225789 [Mycena sp. CBHHK59/15]|nr:hypothetical protein B0H10DRAFT_2225789 [Mycena sp. CBHHK59/15]